MHCPYAGVRPMLTIHKWVTIVLLTISKTCYLTTSPWSHIWSTRGLGWKEIFIYCRPPPPTHTHHHHHSLLLKMGAIFLYSSIYMVMCIRWAHRIHCTQELTVVQGCSPSTCYCGSYNAPLEWHTSLLPEKIVFWKVDWPASQITHPQPECTRARLGQDGEPSWVQWNQMSSCCSHWIREHQSVQDLAQSESNPQWQNNSL